MSIVFLLFLYFISKGDIVIYFIGIRIGECIYLGIKSIFDGVFVILIDLFVMNFLVKYIYGENVKVDELSKEMFVDRKVFKFGVIILIICGFI